MATTYELRREAFHSRLCNHLDRTGYGNDRYGRKYNIGPVVEFAMNYQLDNETPHEIIRLHGVNKHNEVESKDHPKAGPSASKCILL
jgi:hypothetical protein